MDGGERERLRVAGGGTTGWCMVPTPVIEAADELRGWLVRLRRANWLSIDKGLLALACLALLGQLAYPVGWVIGGALQHGYSIINNYVSDLGAHPAADSWVMNAALILFGGSFFVVSLALRRSLSRSRARTVALAWFVAVGVAFVATGLVHEDCWATTSRACWTQQQAGALSWQHYAHGYISLAEGLLLDLSPLILVFALPRGLLRKACGVCAAIGVAGAIASVGTTAAGLGFRDGGGLFERVYAAVVNGWVVALFAAMLLADLIATSGGNEGRQDHHAF